MIVLNILGYFGRNKQNSYAALNILIFISLSQKKKFCLHFKVISLTRLSIDVVVKVTSKAKLKKLVYHLMMPRETVQIFLRASAFKIYSGYNIFSDNCLFHENSVSMNFF